VVYISDFQNRLESACGRVNELLFAFLGERSGVDDGLMRAVEYALGGDGKRIRPVLVLWCCELVSGSVNHSAEAAAVAIEMVHTYSLVHDDLPAMDDDDFRRGRASCHKAFDEATAMLAGDALLTLAFEILTEKIDTPSVAVKLISELSKASGAAGMIAGQMADLRSEGRDISRELLEGIHTNKTARMFRCAAAMGAICGSAERGQYDSLCEYGLKIGLGFQIADDILDVSGTSEHLGKTAGKDAKAGKCTYPKVVGLAESKRLAKRIADEAIRALESFGGEADILRQLAESLVERTR